MKDTMKNTDHHARAQFLAAVEREAVGLPADRRRELLADLTEHIEVALSERPGDVRDVLRELGDPRAIAATAFRESGQIPEPKRGRVHPVVPVLLLGGCIVVAIAVLPDIAGPVIGFVLRVTGLVLLFTSVHWTLKRKLVGATLTVVLPIAIRQTEHFHDYIDAQRLMANILIVGLPLAGAGWLWLVRRRPV